MGRRFPRSARAVCGLGLLLGCQAYDPELLREQGQERFGTTQDPADAATVSDGHVATDAAAVMDSGGANPRSSSDAGGDATQTANPDPDAGPVAPAADASSDATLPLPLRCGNGKVEDSERCDVGLPDDLAGACPTECEPVSACVEQRLAGEGCLTHCEPAPRDCTDDDDCCPTSCTPDNDDDCSPTCGDGIVQDEVGETCEPDSDTPCLTEADCDDGNPCTRDLLSGNEENCNTSCDHSPITELTPEDGCCPEDVEANANTDSDCEPECGNEVVEGDEECDGSVGCDECELTVTPEQLRCLTEFPGDACRECECIQCTELAFDCFDSGDEDRDMHCTAIETCGRETDCAVEACFCGTSLLCLDPDGACMEPISTAAGTDDPFIVADLTTDPEHALNRFHALGTCSIERCSQVCP